MKKILFLIFGLVSAYGLGHYNNSFLKNHSESQSHQVNLNTNKEKMDSMKLGAFSVSLNVKDIKVSKAFYENLGFTVFGGNISQNYLIMKNEKALIGLFQGMFEGNILTFNPGWDENAQNIEKFDDVRAIQKHLKSNNVLLTAEADANTTGPASIMLADPDGNMILIDQHR